MADESYHNYSHYSESEFGSEDESVASSLSTSTTSSLSSFDVSNASSSLMRIRLRQQEEQCRESRSYFTLGLDPNSQLIPNEEHIDIHDIAIENEKNRTNKVFFQVDIENCRCPITLRFMKDPVIASDGQVYELEAIKKVLKKRDPVSPITRERLGRTLVPFPRIAKQIFKEAIKAYNVSTTIGEDLHKQAAMKSYQFRINIAAVSIQRAVKTHLDRRNHAAIKIISSIMYRKFLNYIRQKIAKCNCTNGTRMY